MFRRRQRVARKRVNIVPWMVAVIGLGLLWILASGLDIAEDESAGKVNTVASPSAEAIGTPLPTRIPGDVAQQDRGQDGAEAAACDDLLIMVGPDHTLAEDYVPPDLALLGSFGIATRGSDDMLRENAAEQLASLVSAAAQDDVEVLVASGYRSYWEQKGTFEWFKDEYGEDAGKLSVPPGQSEHQLGTAVDFASAAVNYELVPGFAETRAGKWLTKHAAQYGFVLSYGKDQAADTGVIYEPWHYRYVGVDRALKIKANDKPPMTYYHEGASECYEG
ncbi:hypothetical protein BH23ACT11_BH23ACT11_23040 [soil metagenome]